jgi:ferrochelatase
MAYGTPRSPDDVEAYYTDIRRGRPPMPEQLDDLRSRYEAIGGISPLAQRTEAQRAAIADELDERHPGAFRVVLGNKHAPPFISDAISSLADMGVANAVVLALAPHYSDASIGDYQRRAAEAGAAAGVDTVGIDHWHLEPAYLDFLADAVREARATLPARHKVLFTAHSLPERVLVGDPYPDELLASATEVAGRVGLGRWQEWAIAWQSAGRTPEPWRGPDILDVIQDLGETGRSEGVLVCAQGFVADHLEVLYDLDIDARRVAEQNGLVFARTRSLNAEPRVMRALAALVADRAEAVGWMAAAAGRG